MCEVPSHAGGRQGNDDEGALVDQLLLTVRGPVVPACKASPPLSSQSALYPLLPSASCQTIIISLDVCLLHNSSAPGKGD